MNMSRLNKILKMIVIHFELEQNKANFRDGSEFKIHFTAISETINLEEFRSVLC